MKSGMALDTVMVLNVLSGTPTAAVLYDQDRQQQNIEDIKDLRNFEYICPYLKRSKGLRIWSCWPCTVLAILLQEGEKLGKNHSVNFREFSEAKITLQCGFAEGSGYCLYQR